MSADGTQNISTAESPNVGRNPQSLMMQYAKIEITDRLELNCQEIGEELEQELESLGFQVKLSTSADWGYVFRTKSDGQAFDISIVPIAGDSFGIAIEPEKGLLSEIYRAIKKPNIKGMKEWLEEILTTDVGAKRIRWFTADEWMATFGQGFWNHTPK